MFKKKNFVHNFYSFASACHSYSSVPRQSALDLATGMPNFINKKDYSTVLHKSNFYKMNCIFLFKDIYCASCKFIASQSQVHPSLSSLVIMTLDS